MGLATAVAPAVWALIRPHDLYPIRANWEHMVAAVFGEYHAALARLVQHHEGVPEGGERAIIEPEMNPLIAAEVVGRQLIPILAASRLDVCAKARLPLI